MLLPLPTTRSFLLYLVRIAWLPQLPWFPIFPLLPSQLQFASHHDGGANHERNLTELCSLRRHVEQTLLGAEISLSQVCDNGECGDHCHSFGFRAKTLYYYVV
jgi:hypothetical protein